MLRAFILKIVLKLHGSVVFSESVHVNEPNKNSDLIFFFCVSLFKIPYVADIIMNISIKLIFFF